MATISTAIKLTDRMTAPLHGILNALNLTISGFQDMQNTAAQDIDTSSIEAAREQINQATMALHELEASGINVPINTPDVIVPEPLIEQPAPVEVPISWQSSGMDIFTNSGIERFESEIQSANNMLNTLHTTQQQISDTAAQTDLFPDNMVADLNSVNSRIQRIQSIIQQIERNPINQVASDEVNNGLERLRSRLNQAVEQQRELNQAMEEMDISNANAAYDQLQNTISEIEMYLRDNVDEQGRFNQRIQEGQKHADNLMSTIKKMAAAYLSMRAVTEVIDLSDTMSLAESRLSLIVDDGGSVEELEKKIFASAQRARANYQDTIDIVSKLGLLAGKAFTSNDEIIAFQELMNKNFIVGGASAQEQASAMYQLTQAMASGRLQGDEYRSIVENAPLLAKAIEDYMVKVKGAEGTMKEWASEGLLTADVIKAALFSSADEIEERFNDMPMTFGQVWTSIKNQALVQFQPVLKKLNEVANNEKFNKMVIGVTNALTVVATVATEIFDVVASIGSWAYDNWSTLEPIIWGIVAAMAVWKVATLLHAASVGIAAAAEAGYTGIKGIAIGVTAALTGSTIAATAAQWGFNTALFSCPIVWILAALIALVVLFVMFTEEIMGAIFWLGALFKNLGLWIANLGIAAWEVIKNIGLWFANLGLSIWAGIKNVGLWFANLGLGIWEVLKACASNVMGAFQNAWINIQIGFWSVIKAIVEGVKTAIEWLNKIPGVDISTTGITNAVNSYTQKMAELEASKYQYEDIGEAWDRGFNTYKYESVSEAYNTFEYGSVSDAFHTFDTFEEGWGSSAYAAGAEVGAGISDWIDNNLSMNALLKKFGATAPESTAYDGTDLDVSQYLADIADDTNSIAGSVELSGEELKYLRDIAERDAVNRFTTAELTVNFSSDIKAANSEVDLDGVVAYLEERVQETLEMVAEGVHA